MRQRLVLLLAVLVLSGCAIGPKDQSAPDPIELATSGRQTGDLLAYGVVTRGGEPVAGAKVVLQVDPYGGGLTPDAPLERWSAPTVTTDDGGAWALKLDPADVPVEYFPESYSFLEFQLVFASGSRLATWSGAVYRRSEPDLWRTEGGNPPDSVLKVDVDLDSGDVVAIDSTGEKSTPGSDLSP